MWKLSCKAIEQKTKFHILPGCCCGVGTGVGCGVGTGVGCGVGTGVGCGVGAKNKLQKLNSTRPFHNWNQAPRNIIDNL